LVGIPLFSSCAYQYNKVVPEKRILYNNDVSSVAVLPFLNLTDKHGEIDEAGEAFSYELARFREVKIVHPSAIKKYLEETNVQLTSDTVASEARAIGSFFNVQSVIVGSVTEFNPYYPPLLGMSIVLIDVATGKVIDSRNVVYDASFNYIRQELSEYVALKDPSTSLFRDDYYLHKADKFIQFVCHQFIKKYL
jgi:hypothetical protein